MTNYRGRAGVAVLLLALVGGLLVGCSSGNDGTETRDVLQAVLAMDRAGLHALDEAINTDGEIPTNAYNTALDMQTLAALTPWPDELRSRARDLETVFADLAAALAGEAPDVEVAGPAATAAHDAQHDFSHLAWEWLREQAGIDAPQAPGDGAGSNATSPTASSATIEIVEPRLTFTLGNTAAGYLVVRNNGDEADVLISAHTSIGHGSLHEVVTDGPAGTMQQVQGGIEIPAHGELELKSGSYHVMVEGIEPRLSEGDEVEIVLQFERAGEIRVTVTAEQLSASAGSDDHDDHD